ncbi:MAG: prolyl-tRNA synthetase associated domain-containing protein [Bacilli bacterium]|nr:prolyl-tRNA synthetase associated domain-containing protein [Bacilli bacterium]
MLTKKEDVLKKLDELKIDYELMEHEAVYTIEEMENLNMPRIDEVIKNLFVRDEKKQNYYLIIVSKNKSVNLKELRRKIECKPLTFAKEEDLYKYLGLTKGAVTPLGVFNDKDAFVHLIIDKDLYSYERIGIHPNENTATVWVKLDDIIKLYKDNGNDIIDVEI